MKQQLLIIIGLVMLVFACTSPLDKKFDKETVNEDLEAIKGKISDDEWRILEGAVIDVKFRGVKIGSKTYAELLALGKKWEAKAAKEKAEQEVLAKKAAQEEAKRLGRLRKLVDVSIDNKRFAKLDNQGHIILMLSVQNKSDKTIKAVKGSLTFNNLSGEKIYAFNFVYDQLIPIRVGKKVTWGATAHYNSAKEKDRIFKNKALKDMKVVWQPKKITFSDGTTL